MSAQVGDTQNPDPVRRAKAVPVAPYASRGAGLYSEVSWDPGAPLLGRAAGPRTAGAGPGQSRRPAPLDKA
jgi:hypothetical protein